MPLTLIYSLPKISTKGAMGHWAKKLNAEMYIQKHYPSLANILGRGGGDGTGMDGRQNQNQNPKTKYNSNV